MKVKSIVVAVVSLFIFHCAFAFEGYVTAGITRGGAISSLLYTVGTNYLRIEQITTGRPRACDIVNLQTGEWTLIFPQNSTFVRLSRSAMSPGARASFLPPGVLTQGMPPSGMGMPAMPLPPMEKIELVATGETTNLLGLPCARYEITHHGQTMEIWATDQISGFEPYRQNQPPRFGPRLIEEQWGELLKAKNLFPLLAVLKFDNGAERLRFEVKSITSVKVTDENGELFQPPPGYLEIQPLPF